MDVQVVYQLLQLHTLDKIKKFLPFFCLSDKYSSVLTERINIVKVERFGELVLDLSGISSLNLTCWILEHPQDVKGFKTLRSVAIYRVVITGDQLGEIISGSPLLEDLTLSCYNSLKSVKIDHLQLKRLRVEDGDKQPEPEESQGQGSSCDKPTMKDIPSLNEASEMLTIDLDFYFELSRDVDHLYSRLSN
ncbi:F-box protein At5g03100-like [Aristolochia californica]|uniref:F-box protein At5g03100-like n=1 Tax=Aristolochia californica TaxID=171875 RepID=UPI0035E09C49